MGTLDQRHADLLDQPATSRQRAPTSKGWTASELPAATWRRCTRSRASSSHASTRRRIAGSTSSARRQRLKGKLAIANAKLAYARYRQLFLAENELWRELAAAGAQPSGACGPRPRRRTRPTGTFAMSRS